MSLLKYRSQPYKALYISYQLTRTVVWDLPFWVLYSLVPRWRPRPTWTFRQSLTVQIMKRIGLVMDNVGPLGSHVEPDHTSLEVNDGENGLWIPPLPSSYITPELQSYMNKTGTSAVQIPAYWHPSPPSSPSSKVILNLHGGGYTSLSAHHTSEVFSIIKAILSTSPTPLTALCLEYRLSKGPPLVPAYEHGFPAALLDALSAYIHLLSQGYKPKDIIVQGDSAGGNLALGLTRYLVSYFPDLTPGGLLLMSPWSDVSYPITKNATMTSWGMYADFDPEPQGLMRYSQLAIASGEDAAQNVYLSPASREMPEVSFVGFPKTFISSGTSEGYNYQQNLELRDRMKRDLGDKVVYVEGKDMLHDFVMLEWCEPERGKTLEAIAAWIDSLDSA